MGCIGSKDDYRKDDHGFEEAYKRKDNYQTRGIPPPMGARHHSGVDTLGRKRDSGGGGMDTLGRKRDGGNVDRRGSQPPMGRPMPAAVGGVGGSTFDPHRDLHIQTLVQDAHIRTIDRRNGKTSAGKDGGGGTRDRRDSGFQEKYGKMSASYEVDRSMSGGGYGTTGRRDSGGGQRREAGGGMDQATPASKKDDFSRNQFDRASQLRRSKKKRRKSSAAADQTMSPGGVSNATANSTILTSPAAAVASTPGKSANGNYSKSPTASNSYSPSKTGGDGTVNNNSKSGVSPSRNQTSPNRPSGTSPNKFSPTAANLSAVSSSSKGENTPASIVSAVSSPSVNCETKTEYDPKYGNLI